MDGGTAATAPESSAPGNVCQSAVVGGACTGKACSALIDNMSGPSAEAIPFTPPSCAGHGAWFAGMGGTPAGAITTPSPPSPFAYTALPGGPPPSGPTTATAGACFAGVTSAQQYQATSSMVVALASVSPTAAGNASALPVLIDASAYHGIEFWLWEANDALVPPPEFYLLVGDKAETKGFGICDGTFGGPKGCVGPVATLPPQPGWQFLQIPWSGFLSLPNTGSANEAALDPTTLTALDFQVQEFAPGATTGVTFNFCILALSFF
jgi:hypothetical protein